MKNGGMRRGKVSEVKKKEEKSTGLTGSVLRHPVY